MNGSAEDVFAHFTDADKFSRWFVVTGYRTPASRIALDPRPGGQVTGVLVSEETGTEIPFVARYGSIDAPRLLQFVFADPPEVVTITLRPRADGRTELHYRNEGVSPDEQDHAIASVNHMLDALQSCIPD